MSNFSELHYFAQIGDLPAIHSLLASGANPNVFDDIGFTPLHYASKEENIEVINELLKAGAAVNAQDESKIGNTPLGEVAGKCSFEVAAILVDCGADPTIKGWMQLSALDRARTRKKEEGRRVYDLLVRAAEHRNSPTRRCS